MYRNIYLKLSKDGTTLLKCDKNAKGVVILPHTVYKIQRNAFRGCKKVFSIKIPKNVSIIEENAFQDCTSLTSIIMPERIINISKYTFSGCTSLTSIEIPYGVTEIKVGAFSGCTSLTSIGIPKGITYIGEYTFSGCTSLTSIEIPYGVTEIKVGAFSGCTSLTSIGIPESVTWIQRDAFSGCTSLTSIMIPGSVTWIGNRSNHTPKENPDYEDELDKEVKINSETPKANTVLRDITKESDKETKIYTGPKMYYTFLSDIPSPLMSPIKGKMNSLIEKINILNLEENNLETVRINSYTKLIDVGGLTIHSDTIGPVFSSCDNLYKIQLKHRECPNLLNFEFGLDRSKICLYVPTGSENSYQKFKDYFAIIVPDNMVVSKDGKTLISCDKNIAGDVSIPNGITEIGEKAFGWCKCLSSIIIPSSVERIGEKAFENCNNLSVINLKHQMVSEVLNNKLGLNPRNITLIVSNCSVDDYKRHKYYSLFKNIISETQPIK